MAKKSKSPNKPNKPSESFVMEDKSITSATIQHPRFTITKAKAGDKAGDKACVKRIGRMKFDLTYDDGKVNTVKVILNLVACWVDPNNNNCIEAFAVTHANEGIAALKKVMKEIPTVRVTTEPGFTVTALGDCFRYATKEEAGDYSSENELYESVEYFPSKHAAIMKVLSILERYNAVGGFESANLNLVSDKLLESIGFFKVAEVTSEGCQSQPPTYWGANTSEMFTINSDSTSGRHMSYSERDREVTKMAVLFADMMRKEIESLVASPAITGEDTHVS